LTFDATVAGLTKFKANTYFEIINSSGTTNTSIHTSCSKPVWGKSFANLTVIGYTSKNGPVCDPYSCDGEITLTGSGGTPPYTYTWSNGMTGDSLNELCSDDYYVTITDASGCFSIDTFTVIDSCCLAPMEITATITNNGCGIVDTNQIPCDCDGGIVTLDLRYLGIGGATIMVYKDKNYTTLINTFTNVQTGNFITVDATAAGLTKLASNTYFVITDSTGTSYATIHTSCSQDIYGNIYGPFRVEGYTSVNGPVCAPITCSGIIVVATSGGESPYSYVWSNGMTGDSITGLCEGDYTLTVTDAEGCKDTMTFTVGQDPAPNYIITVETESDTCGSVDTTQIPCDCDGKMTTISLLYNGPNGVTINCYKDKNHSTLIQSIANVDAGDILIFSAAAGGLTKFESNTYFEVVGVNHVHRMFGAKRLII
jgi:SprB repeat